MSSCRKNEWQVPALPCPAPPYALVALTTTPAPSPLLRCVASLLVHAAGALYAGLHGLVQERPRPTGPLCVVITGATRGIGKALAREFLRAGDKVFISARSMRGVREAAAQLREEVGPSADVSGEWWVGLS